MRSRLRAPWTAKAPHACRKRRRRKKLAGWFLDALLRAKPKEFNPTTYLCGRRAELRFTVRRPAGAEVSPCCHRPSAGDVACSVHVGVARPCVADFALENRLALAVHPDLPESFVHTCFSPRRAAMRPGEKVAHGLGVIPQRLLLHGLRAGRQPAVLGTSRGQLSTLLGVARRMTSRLPMLLLLDGQVPYIPSVAAMLGQRCPLLSGGEQPISHRRKLTATTDKLTKGEAAFAPNARRPEWRDKHRQAGQ